MDDWNPFLVIEYMPPPDATELERAAAQTWASPAGRMLLDHLVAQTLGRVLPPTATDAELRHLEGQRGLMNHVKSLILKGRNNG